VGYRGLTSKPLVALRDVNCARERCTIGGRFEHAPPLIHGAVVGNAGAHTVAGNDSCDDGRIERVNDARRGAGDDVALPELSDIASTPGSNRAVAENGQHVVFTGCDADDVF
jgi:hypothetical protein